MKLNELQSGERGIVTYVDCAPPLKERLRSLNIRAGGVVHVIKISYFKRVFLVQAGGSRVALRREVAECITVERK